VVGGNFRGVCCEAHGLVIPVKLFADDEHFLTGGALDRNIIAFPILFFAETLWIKFYGFHVLVGVVPIRS